MEELSLETANPASQLFESQAQDEKVILLLRAHIITNLPWIVAAFILALLPLVLINFNFLAFVEIEFNFPFSAAFGLVLLWYFFVFAFVFQQFLSWYFNVYIVTSERVVDFDFYQLFYKRVSSAELDKVEDVTISTGGIPQLIFNYGNVFIQTAAEVVEFEFIRVPHPAIVQKAIEQAIDKGEKAVK